MWDVIFYTELRKEGIMCPPDKKGNRSTFAGGYVMKPKAQKYGWGITEDLASLYPHCQMQWNISPECIVEDREREDVSWDHLDDKLLNCEIDVDDRYILAGNGHYFRKDIKGFVPKVLEKIYNERVIAKKEMIRLKQEYEAIITELSRRELE